MEFDKLLISLYGRIFKGSGLFFLVIHIGVLVVLAGCGRSALATPIPTIQPTEHLEEPEDTQILATPTTLPPTPSEEVVDEEQRIIAAAVSGVVSVLRSASTDFEDLSNNELLFEGDLILIGEDGRLALVQENNAVVTLVEGTSVKITQLQGEQESFSARYSLLEGTIFAILNTSLAKESSLEISSQDGIAAIHGTCLSVSSKSEINQTVATCLAGRCSWSGLDETIEFSDGDALEVQPLSDPPIKTRIMTPEEVDAWIDNLAFLESVGIHDDCGDVTSFGEAYEP